MARSFVGGFLGALLALALVGAVMSVRGQAGQDEYRALLLRQIDQYERWQRDDLRGQLAARGIHAAARDEWLAWHPELDAYLAYMVEARRQEMCPVNATDYCVFVARTFGPREMRDAKYLDGYLATRR